MATNIKTTNSWVQKTQTCAAATPVFATPASRYMGSCIIGNSASPISRLLEMIQGLTPEDLAAAWDY